MPGLKAWLTWKRGNGRFGGIGDGVWDFGDGGEVSKEWVGDDILDDGLGVGGGALVLAEVCGGDLEAIEEHAGPFKVDIELGEAAEDVVEGDLDGGAIVDARHEEVSVMAGEARFAAGGLVVVAEFLAAESRRAAAMTFGEDVAAEVAAFWVGGGGGDGFRFVHGDLLEAVVSGQFSVVSLVVAVLPPICPHPPYLGPKVLLLKVLGLGKSLASPEPG